MAKRQVLFKPVELNIPLVHISAGYVFDGSGVVPWCVSDTLTLKISMEKLSLSEEAIKASKCTYAILRTS